MCYALAIYILNLFLAFLQPRFDPSLAADLAADDVEEGAPGLPGSEPKSPGGGLRGLMNGFSSAGEDEEFRPFIRRLPGGLRGLRTGEVKAEYWNQSSSSGTLPRRRLPSPSAALSLAQQMSPYTGLSSSSTSLPYSASPCAGKSSKVSIHSCQTQLST